MPSADPELQDRMIARFGSIMDDGPSQFLVDAGYIENGGMWKPKPGVVSLKDMTRDEFECLLFLIHEWDHGHLIERTP